MRSVQHFLKSTMLKLLMKLLILDAALTGRPQTILNVSFQRKLQRCKLLTRCTIAMLPRLKTHLIGTMPLGVVSATIAMDSRAASQDG